MLGERIFILLQIHHFTKLEEWGQILSYPDDTKVHGGWFGRSLKSCDGFPMP
jgi:hypothetical protein